MKENGNDCNGGLYPGLNKLKMKTPGCFALFCILLFPPLWAGKAIEKTVNKTIEIAKTTSPPRIDGVLDDPVWKTAKGYSRLVSFQPEYGKPVKEKTIIYTAYDADHIYIAFKCYDREPKKVRATIRKRDSSSRDDLVAVFIDSHNDGQNAYYFQSNPLGIQTDGILDSDAYTYTPQDFIWKSGGVKDKDGFTVEFKIPFKSLRYKKSPVVDMRVGFMRHISRYSESFTFPDWDSDKGSVIGQFSVARLEGINYRRVMELLPVATYRDQRELDENERLTAVNNKKVHLGLTSKIGLTSEMTLDIAANPDFSHIESDEGQVDVNLRIDALREEKRPFFLEGLEHFSFAATGYDSPSPIELIVDTRNIMDPILGLKLSGKTGKSGTVNSLFAIDESPKNAPPDPGNPGQAPGDNYFGIFRYKHLFNKNDSYLGGVYTGKSFDGGHHHVAGLDSRVRFNGSMTLNTYFLHSFKKSGDDITGATARSDGPAYGWQLNYDGKNQLAYLGFHDLSREFSLDPGRLERNGIRIFSGYIERYLFLHSDVLKRITLGYAGALASDKHSEMNEYSHELFTQLDFSSSTWLRLGYHSATEVVNDFSTVSSLSSGVVRGFLFKRNRYSIMARSQATRQVYLQLEYGYGGYPHYELLVQGDLNRLELALHFQPVTKFSSEFIIKRHIFHQRDSGEKLYDIKIFRNKTIYQVNKNLSLRGILEYNSDLKRILCDALVEFTLIPGTVFHLGYGPTIAKEYQADNISRPLDRYRTISSTFFFKASYRFRF
ncbi:MAG: carbohydrate binding family 9 domain-containing protein [bacterium]|nr:carbohydrate binding family 9 domain-containing protein [bacterium]